MTRQPAQIPLFLATTTGRYDPVEENEAAEIGHALLARLRGEPLTPTQRALLDRSALPPVDADRRAPTPVVDVSQTLLTLGRGDDAEVRISWRRYRGSSPFLDIRRWERGDSEGMRPTRQGVTIRAKELPRLLRVVVDVARRVGASEEAPLEERGAESDG